MKKATVCIAAAGVSLLASALELPVDFAKDSGTLNKDIHSSGWAPRSYPRSIQNDDAALKALNLTYTRTHDWALVNSGQRIIDYQYIFPLFNKDAKDPSNYYFEPTDRIIKLSRDIGMEIFYRLGTSIEHTGDVHFNARVPDDFDKTAEIFAATVRHYNKGWANGFNWNIKYWEIWNEPDGLGTMWWLPGPVGRDAVKMREKFGDLFVKCIKRIKSEFPDVKVGGPALCWASPEYFRYLLERCKKAGVKPDFLSWHYYGSNPQQMIEGGNTIRKICDELGFKDIEFILNEYHYILSWDGIHGRNSTPAMVKRALDGPTGHNNIDSACFYLTALSLFQKSEFSQAYYYGCAHQGNWGYMDQYKMFNKPYYAARMFGSLVKNYPKMCELQNEGTITTLALKSADSKKAALLVTDYRGVDQVIELDVNGLGKVKHVSARVLDHERDEFPCDVEWRNGKLTLVKKDKNSAAFLVTFDL